MSHMPWEVHVVDHHQDGQHGEFFADHESALKFYSEQQAQHAGTWNEAVRADQSRDATLHDGTVEISMIFWPDAELVDAQLDVVRRDSAADSLRIQGDTTGLMKSPSLRAMSGSSLSSVMSIAIDAPANPTPQQVPPEIELSIEFLRASPTGSAPKPAKKTRCDTVVVVEKKRFEESPVLCPSPHSATAEDTILRRNSSRLSKDISIVKKNKPKHLPSVPRLEPLEPLDAVAWFTSSTDRFFEPPDESGEQCSAEIRTWLHSLHDGDCIGFRGRAANAAASSGFTPWDYGFALKSGPCLFYIYQNGTLECLTIDHTNFSKLVHIALPREHIHTPVATPSHYSRVLILSHGWSPLVGPNYALVRTLERVAMSRNWHVVVPDFRAVYKYGSQRSRAERTRMIYEEIICLYPRPQVLALAGHSQGGAASAYCCTPRVVSAANIRGLMLIGSEHPCSLDAMSWRPPVTQLEIVHAEGDSVVSVEEISDAATRWGVKPHILPSPLRSSPRTSDAAAVNCGDDVCHDFLRSDLMEGLVVQFTQFLVACEQSGDDGHHAAFDLSQDYSPTLDSSPLSAREPAVLVSPAASATRERTNSATAVPAADDVPAS
eukprot:gnl/Spiro4/18380_TR9837_c0_g1_i1.p1 gnl/Spiro4/18380_TR9837_c0_g1~~gnl/Spiro4/18380_TR9837_c0_g1_i1.p1  ORF type:complete len:604 (+),score=208.82 gnl/Spiro4/18380_TR9837_c0_g1_i1:101-1912(+)